MPKTYVVGSYHDFRNYLQDTGDYAAVPIVSLEAARGSRPAKDDEILLSSYSLDHVAAHEYLIRRRAA